MSKKKQIDQEKISEEIQTLTKLIDQNNAVVNHQMEEVGRLVREMNQKAKENNKLITKAKELLEQINDKQPSQKKKSRKRL